MLEHFEINELEKRWENYNNSKKKAKFNFNKVTGFRLDNTVIFLLVLIFSGFGAIIWIFFSKDDVVINLPPQKELQNLEKNITNEKVVKSNEAENRGILKLNDVGIDVSVDTGGFNLNTYENNQNKPKEDKKFSTIPKDEIIDFGNPPSPPKSLSVSKKQSKSQEQAKITIKTSSLKAKEQNLEDKFNSTHDIKYSLMISEEAYEKKDYEKAIKWALISNDIDKKNVKSWVFFAKASYKKGDVKNALLALQHFNKINPSKEVDDLIKKIKAGNL
ncbi:hypothetical protein F1B92_06155 [Campylobacter sp. FMV-PI01]|uniref:Transformation system protein n=1 Tax=Campylobacter portucalensis TaxID=2608384 RepID=A0A6L5WKH3_9BACT|nr:hypothetical protein [Campylobacter portucalensis]MSN96747.1 hypothetical protein [Campylobacter portucalensis]